MLTITYKKVIVNQCDILQLLIQNNSYCSTKVGFENVNGLASHLLFICHLTRLFIQPFYLLYSLNNHLLKNKKRKEIPVRILHLFDQPIYINKKQANHGSLN